MAVPEANLPSGISGDFFFMCHHHDGETILAVEFAEELHDLMRACRIQIAGWLVGEDDVGVGHQGTGNGDALLLAARQFGRGMVATVGQPHARQCLLRHATAFLVRDAAIDQGQLQILDRRGALEEIESLENEADVIAAENGAVIAAQGPDIDAVKEIMTRSWRVQRSQYIHAGGFSRTRRPEDRNEFTGTDGKVHAGQRMHGGFARAVGLADLLELDERPDRLLAHFGLIDCWGVRSAI